MTDPSPIKSVVELSYCRYCRGFLLDNEQEIQQGFHHDCHTDIEAYSKLFVLESALLKQLEAIVGQPIPQVANILLKTFGYIFENGIITGLGLYGLSSIPESIGQLTSLKSLNLSNNELTTLPEALGQLTNLQILRLSNNELTTLPEALGQLTNLQTLLLDNNQLTTLPDWIGQLTNLQTLYLYANQLTTLPDWIGQLTNLERLTLDNNQLTTLPEALGQLPNLDYIQELEHRFTLGKQNVK